MLVPGGVTLPPRDGEDAGKVQSIGARFAHGELSLEAAADLGCRACGSPGGGCQFLGTAATSQVVGEALAKGAPCATVESVKAAAEVYLPVKGTVTAVNEALPTTPELINRDAYGGAWMVKIKIGDPGELAGLLDAAAYEAYCQERAT